MEITTILGIVVAVVIMLLGIRMIMKKPADAAPSLESELHIDSDTQQPIIPRHVRAQLGQQEESQAERVEPSLANDTHVQVPTDKVEPILVAETKAQENSINPLDTPDVVEDAAEPKSEFKAEQKLEAVEVAVEQTAEEAQPTAVDLSLNSHIEKAKIAEFDEESSILDAHLHEQKLVDDASALANAETIISLSIFPQGRVLSGEKTLKVLLKYGLRFGELACFHRYSEDDSRLLFSVLQITETGMEGFDLETLSTEEVKGLAFFLALPHGDVQNAFDTMDSISRLIAREVDGVVYDQNQQEFTPQMREFWRHQAIDYRPGQPAEV